MHGLSQKQKNQNTLFDLFDVLPSDNLTNARFVLVVEGECDKIIPSSILPNIRLRLKQLLNNNLIEIRSIDGSGKLTFTLHTLSGRLRNYLVFVDHDSAEKQAVEEAKERGLLQDAQVKYCMCKGQSESEIEDRLNMDLYKVQLEQTFVFNLSKSFRFNQKWSKRLKATFQEFGQLWNTENEKKAKTIVVQAVEENPQNALNEHKRSSIDALAKQLESMNIEQ